MASVALRDGYVDVAGSALVSISLDRPTVAVSLGAVPMSVTTLGFAHRLALS